MAAWEVESEAPAPQAPSSGAWEVASEAPAATKPLTFGSTLGGEAELLGSGIANIPHAAAHGAVDLYRRITGGDTDAPDPAAVRAIQVPVGEAGRHLVGDVAELPPVQAVASGAKAADTALGNFSPTLQDVVHQAGSVANDVLSIVPAAGVVKGATEGISGAVKAAAENTANTASLAPHPVTALRAAGYQFRPSDVAAMTPGTEAALPARALESAVGVPEARQIVGAHNTGISQGLASNAIGANTSQTRGLITDPMLSELRQPHFAVYDRLAAVPGESTPQSYTDAIKAVAEDKTLSPDAQDAVDKLVKNYADPGSSAETVASIKSLRQKSSKLIQNDNTDLQDRGFAMRKITDAMEDVLEKRANDAGDTGLLDAFRTSRTALAKNYAVGDALKGGIIDPQMLLRARNNGALLTGDLATVADAAELAPQVVRHPQSFVSAGDTPIPTTVTDLLQGMLRNVGGRRILQGPYQKALGPGPAEDSTPQVLQELSQKYSALAGPHEDPISLENQHREQLQRAVEVNAEHFAKGGPVMAKEKVHHIKESDLQTLIALLGHTLAGIHQRQQAAAAPPVRPPMGPTGAPPGAPGGGMPPGVLQRLAQLQAMRRMQGGPPQGMPPQGQPMGAPPPGMPMRQAAFGGLQMGLNRIEPTSQFNRGIAHSMNLRPNMGAGIHPLRLAAGGQVQSIGAVMPPVLAMQMANEARSKLGPLAHQYGVGHAAKPMGM